MATGWDGPLLRQTFDQRDGGLSPGTRALITGFDERGSCGRTFIPNEMVAALAERHPEPVA